MPASFEIDDHAGKARDEDEDKVGPLRALRATFADFSTAAAGARDGGEDIPRRATVSGASTKPRRLSTVSKNYDVGKKGFLTQSEAQLRSYDTNNDGGLDVVEMKKVIGDLRETARQRSVYMKFAGAAAGCFALATVANFGLAWATLVLTRHLDVSGYRLVNKDGEKVNVQARGEKVSLSLNGEYVQRRLSHHQTNRHLLDGSEEDRVAYHTEVGRILEEEHNFELNLNCEQALAIFHNFAESNPTTFDYAVGSTVYTGQIHRVTQTCHDTDTCEQSSVAQCSEGSCACFHNIAAGEACNTYRVECKVDSCTAYKTASAEAREATEEACAAENQGNTEGWMACVVGTPC